MTEHEQPINPIEQTSRKDVLKDYDAELDFISFVDLVLLSKVGDLNESQKNEYNALLEEFADRGISKSQLLEWVAETTLYEQTDDLYDALDDPSGELMMDEETVAKDRKYGELLVKELTGHELSDEEKDQKSDLFSELIRAGFNPTNKRAAIRDALAQLEIQEQQGVYSKVRDMYVLDFVRLHKLGLDSHLNFYGRQRYRHVFHELAQRGEDVTTILAARGVKSTQPLSFIENKVALGE